jgi:DNA-binding response OmpR family regulator
MRGIALDENGKESMLLAYLQAHRGYVVPYRKLCRMLGYRSSGPNERHKLRQYMARARRMLEQRKAPFVLAVASNVGYALCSLAAVSE